MNNFKKDKLSLLKTLLEILEDNLEYGKVNPYDDEGVAELVSTVTDKRRNRKLKSLYKELDKLVSTTKEESYELYNRN